jgi:coenzyme F420-0:L-glutamate ligase / coenzyme F420-1:gamma-L-glutamate ligase
MDLITENAHLRLIDARRMTRRFLDRPVDAAAVEAVLAAATRAPSPHNRQPWRFALLSGATRARLAAAMGAQLRADLTHDGIPTAQIDADVARSHARISGAPTVILVCMSLRDMDVYPDERRNTHERWMAGQSVAAAIQNMLLAAEALNLGACWMCAPLFCGELVRQTLDLPADWEPQALVPLGYSDGPRRDRPRIALESVTVRIDD